MRPRHPRRDPYAVLGLRPGATRAEIHRAYRQRAMESHPDVAGADATGRMAEINEAREALLAHRGPGSGDGRSGGPGDGESPGPAPRERPPRPAWADDHGSAWIDHWAAWNDLPKRD